KLAAPDTYLAHREKKKGDAAMTRRVAVRAADHEAPVGPVRERSPDLLAGDHPFIAVELGARLHVGQVGTGIGLGVALAPQLVARGDPGQEPTLLLLVAEVEDRRPAESFADAAHPAGTAGARVLLVADHP